MARYLGPKHRICRRTGEKLCDNDRCPVTRRSYPPGVHGPRAMRRKISDYGQQLLEKQKCRFTYGLMERQLRTYYASAHRRTGETGQLLARSLETRLDNVVFRLGLAKTRSAARQIVSHGHVLVNGSRVNIPSYETKEDDVISIRERSRKSARFVDYPTLADTRDVPGWLVCEPSAFEGRLVRLPEPDDIQLPFHMQRIVEFYSR
jgi:small subunit ribosomal protein S4